MYQTPPSVSNGPGFTDPTNGSVSYPYTKLVTSSVGGSTTPDYLNGATNFGGCSFAMSGYNAATMTGAAWYYQMTSSVTNGDSSTTYVTVTATTPTETLNKMRPCLPVPDDSIVGGRRTEKILFMNTKIQRLVGGLASGWAGPWMFALLAGCMIASPPVSAQSAPKAASSARGASPGVPVDAFTDDPRVDAKVTLRRRDVMVAETLCELTKVRLAAAGNEAPSWLIAFAVKDEPLRDVLRAMVSLNDCHWRRVKTADGRDVLTLKDISDDPRYWDFLRPKTEAEADLHRGVEAFVQQFAQLPPADQKAFAPDGPGVGYGSLSPAM